MNSNTLPAGWLHLRGKVRLAWGKLTEEDLEQINGDLEYLAEILRERYGYSKAQARVEVDDFRRKMKLQLH